MRGSSSVQMMATEDSTWFVTGIQLEVGSTATDFEYKSNGEELSLCQRYFISAPIGTLVSPAASTYVSAQLPVNMRASPTLVCTPTISAPFSGPMGFHGTFSGLTGVAYTVSAEL